MAPGKTIDGLAIGPRDALITFVTDRPGTRRALRHRREQDQARPRLERRAKPSRPACAGRCAGTSTIPPGGSASAQACTRASGSGRPPSERPAARLRRRRPGRPGVDGARGGARRPGDRRHARGGRHHRRRRGGGPRRERPGRAWSSTPRPTPRWTGRRASRDAAEAGNVLGPCDRWRGRRRRPASPCSTCRPITCSTAPSTAPTRRTTRSPRSASTAAPRPSRRSRGAGGDRAPRHPAHRLGLRRPRQQFLEDDAAARRRA